MKLIAAPVKRQPRQLQEEAQGNDLQPLNHCGKPFEVSLLLTKTLSLRCECYLSANNWLSLAESPELRFIAWRAVERAASERHPAKSGKNEKH